MSRQLWQAVLLRAVDDALNGVPSMNGGSYEQRARETREARAFLTTPNKDFTMVCECAGFDPEAVRDRMRTLIANAPTPEELTAKHKVRARTRAAGSKAVLNG